MASSDDKVSPSHRSQPRETYEGAPEARGGVTRRSALRGAALLGGSLAGSVMGTHAATAKTRGSDECKPKNGEWISLFDGKSLDGWHATPRIFGPIYPGGPHYNIDPEIVRQSPLYPAQWYVEDGAIVGRQDPDHPGFGGFLLTDRHFMDFELKIEVNTDWPTDSGISMRKADRDWSGIQVLIDHRPAGGIGGYFGNSLGGFHAIKFALDRKPDGSGLYVLDPANPLEPVTPAKVALLEYFASEETFLKTWKWQGWNEFTIRSVGKYPRITTHINDVLISKIDLAKLQWPNYDKDAMFGWLGYSGSIGLEVHENGKGDLGAARWGVGAKCRWRNIRIREL